MNLLLHKEYVIQQDWVFFLDDKKREIRKADREAREDFMQMVQKGKLYERRINGIP